MKPLSQWPQQARREIRGVLTDIDDTLTTGGRMTPGVLAALAHLRDAGLRLIAVTGRPTWWAQPLLQLCGFDAVIAENGASAFWLDADGRQQALFYAEPEVMKEHRQALGEFAATLCRHFPHVPVADDMPQRVGDIAFDIGENMPPLTAEQVQEIADFIRRHGLHAAVSSIHAHASLVPFSKQRMAARVLEQVFGVDDASARRYYAFVGDSPNDVSMFAHYSHSIGVANVTRFLDRLPVPPSYVTSHSFGEGFIELTDAILRARRG